MNETVGTEVLDADIEVTPLPEIADEIEEVAVPKAEPKPAVGTVKEDEQESAFNIAHSLTPVLAEGASDDDEQTVSEMAEEDRLTKAKREKVDKASTWEKVQAWNQELADNSLVSRVTRSIGIYDVKKNIFTKDENYFMGGESSLQYISDHNLPPDSFDLISDTESHAELNFITNLIKEEQYIDKMISEILTPSEISGAQIGGAVSTELVAAVVTGGVTIGASMTRIIITEGLVEASIISATSSINHNYRAEDFVVDGIAITAALTLGVVASKTMSKVELRRKTKKTPEENEKNKSKAKKEYTDHVDNARPSVPRGEFDGMSWDEVDALGKKSPRDESEAISYDGEGVAYLPSGKKATQADIDAQDKAVRASQVERPDGSDTAPRHPRDMTEQQLVARTNELAEEAKTATPERRKEIREEYAELTAFDIAVKGGAEEGSVYSASVARGRVNKSIAEAHGAKKTRTKKIAKLESKKTPLTEQELEDLDKFKTANEGHDAYIKKLEDSMPQEVKFDPSKRYAPKQPKLTSARRQANAEAYVASNTLKYNIPKAKHGVRKKTTQIIAHRTAGTGFHPHDTRLTEEGLGAHYTITYDGKIHQVNNDGDKMWHSGTENGHSLGIEVVGRFNKKTQTWEKMTAEQRIALDALTRSMSKKYGISGKQIKAHIEVGNKSAREGIEAKLYMQKILGEQPKRTQARLKKLEEEAAANPSAKGKYHSSQEVDDLQRKHGKQMDKENDVIEANSIDTQQRPKRTKEHTENRKKVFEDDIDKDVVISTKAYDDGREALRKAGTEAEVRAANKAIDDAMDDMYRASYDSVGARTMRIVDSMADDIEITKMELEDFFANDPKGFAQVIDDLKTSHPELMDDLHSVMSTDMTKAEVDSFIKKNTRNGKFTKQGATAFAVLFGGTSIASAGEGEGIGDALTYGAMLMGVGLAVILAPSVLTSIKSGGAKVAVAKAGTKLKDIGDNATDFFSKDAVRRRRVRNIVADSMEFNFLSTTKQFVAGGIKTENLISDLAFNVERGGGSIMDKTAWSHSTMADYDILETKAWKEWKNEQGVTAFSGWMDEKTSIHAFREGLSDALEMKRLRPNDYADDAIVPPSMRDFVDGFDPIKKKIYDRATEYEALGFVDRVDANGNAIKGVSHQDNMLARLWDGAGMNKLLNSADDLPSAMASVSESIAKAITKSIGDPDAAKIIADKMVDNWATNSGLSKGGLQDRTDDIYHAIEGLLDDGVDAAKLGDALAVKGSADARAQTRINFEALDIEDITLQVNGIPTTVGRNQMLDRDIKSILDRTANSIYGHAAIAKNGYKSPEALSMAIDDAVKGLPNGRDLAEKLNQVADYVRGNPIGESDGFISNLIAMGKDLLIVDKLALVAYSVPPEIFATLGAAGYMQGVRSFTRLFTTALGKDSNILQTMSMSGLSTGYQRLDISGFRASIDNLDDSAVVSKLRNGTLRMREISLIGNGLPWLTDKIQKVGMEVNTKKLADFLINKNETISGIQRDRLMQFGLDAEAIKMFENTFEILPNGRVKTFDSSTWSLKKRDKFGEIIRNMNQQTSPEVYIGTTGLSVYTDSLGKSASSLLTYPMMQSNTQGINGMRHLDRTTLMQGIAALMGSYIGISARMEVQGKEISDDDLLLFSMMNMPQFGALSAVRGLTDPAFFGMIKDIFNALVPTELEAR